MLRQDGEPAVTEVGRRGRDTNANDAEEGEVVEESLVVVAQMGLEVIHLS
jgi:hypothetical protein